MESRMFLVDIEATAHPTPHSGLMSEFGIVDFQSRASFHGHVWDFDDHPTNSAIPVVTAVAPSPRHKIDDNPWEYHDNEIGLYTSLVEWLESFGDRPVFVSDNPGFDFMWIAEGFDRNGFKNPFGHASRRIGDLAAGLSGKWRNASGWKKYRKTGHDHNPVNDSLGNAEALHTILVKYNQIEG